jgi:hypothetical protein
VLDMHTSNLHRDIGADLIHSVCGGRRAVDRHGPTPSGGRAE